MKRIVAASIAVLLLAGCGESPWHGKEISGLMPELEFELISESGRTVTEDIFEGRPVAMYFGFTHCPDICPATLARLVAATRRLPEPAAERLQLAFVSVDPGRDGPEELRRYTDAFSERMLGLTGSQDQLEALTRRYRVTFGYEEPAADGSYNVSHSSAILVFDGELAPRLMLLDSLGVAEIAADLERLLVGAGERGSGEGAAGAANP
jgi:protein SCO1/2